MIVKTLCRDCDRAFFVVYKSLISLTKKIMGGKIHINVLRYLKDKSDSSVKNFDEKYKRV